METRKYQRFRVLERVEKNEGPNAMRAIAISNKKGGSAKTTTTVNLAAALAEQGRKVLIVDLDEQYNATTGCAPVGFNPAGGDRGVFDLFADRSKQIEDLLYPTNT